MNKNGFCTLKSGSPLGKAQRIYYSQHFLKRFLHSHKEEAPSKVFFFFFSNTSNIKYKYAGWKIAYLSCWEQLRGEFRINSCLKLCQGKTTVFKNVLT